MRLLKIPMLCLLLTLICFTQLSARVVPSFRYSSIGSEAYVLNSDPHSVYIEGEEFGLFSEVVGSTETDGGIWFGVPWVASAGGNASQVSEVLIRGGRMVGATASGTVSASASISGCVEFGSGGSAGSGFSIAFFVIDTPAELTLNYSVQGDGVFVFSGGAFSVYEVSDPGESISGNFTETLGPGYYNITINTNVSAGTFALGAPGCVDEASGSGNFDLEFTVTGGDEVIVTDGLDIPIANATLSLSKVQNNPPTFSESLQQEVTTDSTGRFTIPTDFEIGDSIKISKLIHAEPSMKHIGLLGTMYSVTIDNAQLDSIGVMSFTEILDTAEQRIKLDHTAIAYNLLVSIEWDAATEYLERTQTAFRNMSNYLYDISDGQARFDTIMIVDDKELWELADFQIYASNAIWPHVDDVGGQFRPAGANSDPVEMPRFWDGGPDESRNLVQSDSALDLILADEYRTRVHEYGHYGLKFGDEYVFTTAAGQCPAISNYGFMYNQYPNPADPYTTEMSNAGRYASAACQNNNHWALYGQSCWGLFESDYENFYGPDNIYAEIYEPAERTLPAGVDFIAGPNNEASLDYNVGALVVFPGTITAPAAEAVDVIVTNPATGTPLPMIAIGVELPGGAIISQGYTSDFGDIFALGASTGSIISASGQITERSAPFGKRFADPTWFSGSLVYDGSPGPLELPLRPVSGSFPFNLRVDLNSPTQEINLDITTPFSAAPILKHIVGSDLGQSNFDALTNGYFAAIDGPVADVGEFRIEALDASDSIFFVGVPYAWHSVTPSGSATRVSAHDGSALLEIDAANILLSQILIASSRYPVLRNGLDPLAIQGGAAQTLAFLPITTLDGKNELTIRYFDSDLQNSARGFGDETSLRIHFWNSDSLRWELVGGSVDTAFNEVTADITEQGVYAAFTTADISSTPCGDANASGQIDIADAVYMINYIFASGPAPVDFSAGDFNCNGSTDIVDAVYLINYIFASGPAPCAACP